MAKISIGVIADVHGDIEAVRKAVSRFNSLDLDFIVLNGDLNDRNHTPGSVERTVGAACGLSIHRIYMHPGSHESVSEYESASDSLRKKHSNLVDANKERIAAISGYDIIFLPGSDFLAGGEYHLVCSEEYETGLYQTQKGPVYLTNMNDLKSQVKNGEKTLLISHVPKKFHTLQGIDVAEYFETGNGRMPAFIVVPEMRSRGISLQEIMRQMIKENVGNEDLETMIRQLNIKKAISGHIHEAGQKANDFYGNLVPESEENPELFLNPGPASYGKAGLYAIDADKNTASYKLLII